MFSPKNSHSPYAPPSRFPYAQWLLATLVAFAAASFPIYRAGVNIVTATYRSGAMAFFAGEIPYRVVYPGSDWYSYSPLFAFLYGVFAYLPDKVHVLSWLLLNIAVFWAGVFCWFKLRRGQSPFFWFAFLLVSAELNISVLYQQTNSLLIGGSLVALAWLREGKPLPAGILLSLITELKPLAIVFSVLLLVRPQLKLIWGFALGAVIAFGLPALSLGLERNIAFHARYVVELFDSVNMHRAEQLDLANVWRLFEWGPTGQVLRWTVCAISVVQLALARRTRPLEPLWIAVGSLALLLVSSRAESPTYAFMAPAYLAVAASLLSEPRSSARATKMIWFVVSAFFITLGFTDLWPRTDWNPYQLSPKFKALGGLSLWTLATWQFTLVLYPAIQVSFSKRQRAGVQANG